MDEKTPLLPLTTAYDAEALRSIDEQAYYLHVKPEKMRPFSMASIMFVLYALSIFCSRSVIPACLATLLPSNKFHGTITAISIIPMAVCMRYVGSPGFAGMFGYVANPLRFRECLPRK